MLLDRNQQLLIERCIVRQCGTLDCFMITSIQSAYEAAHHLCSLIQVYSMTNSLTHVLLYVFRQDTHQWFFMDTNGNEWEVI